MNTTTAQIPPDLLSLLRGVESAPDGDLEWARHCTRQQALILRLSCPGGRVSSLPLLADTIGIPITLVEHIPVRGIAFSTKAGWRIHISESLAPAVQLTVALHEVKHVLDHTVRIERHRRAANFSAADYEHLADYFAALVTTDEDP